MKCFRCRLHHTQGNHTGEGVVYVWNLEMPYNKLIGKMPGIKNVTIYLKIVQETTMLLGSAFIDF